MAVPSAQVQQRAATLLLSVEASPLPDSSSIQGTASALAKLLSSLGAPLMQTHLCCVRAISSHPLLHCVHQDKSYSFVVGVFIALCIILSGDIMRA